MRGLQIWRSATAQSHPEEVDPRVACLCDKAVTEWHLGEISHL